MSKRTSEGELKGLRHNGSENQASRRSDTSDSEDELPKRSKSSKPSKTPVVFGPHPEPKSTSPFKKGIQIKLSSQKISQPTNAIKSKSLSVAAVFNADDDDDEPEEMPPEARMRMRNIGRETPTSAGPNSFGKTKQGFCDSKKIFEKNLKKAMDKTEDSDSSQN